MALSKITDNYNNGGNPSSGSLVADTTSKLSNGKLNRLVADTLGAGIKNNLSTYESLNNARNNILNTNQSGTNNNPSYNYITVQDVVDNGSLLSDYYKQQNEAARNNALSSLAKRLNLNISQYENELNNVEGNYQKLIDQAELDRYKQQRALRETNANRGTLDSGFARQQALSSSINNANTVTGLKSQAESDKQTIRNAIASLKADYESDKATIENQYNNALLQLMSE